MPRAAGEVVGSYFKQSFTSFLAKVHLERQSQMGFSFLRPIQSELPVPQIHAAIQLGTVNADGPQDLIILGLSARADRDHQLPHCPAALQPRGAALCQSLIRRFLPGDVRPSGSRRKGAAPSPLEYAWDMSWCDPCAADPLSADELKSSARPARFSASGRKFS